TICQQVCDNGSELLPIFSRLVKRGQNDPLFSFLSLLTQKFKCQIKGLKISIIRIIDDNAVIFTGFYLKAHRQIMQIVCVSLYFFRLVIQMQEQNQTMHKVLY